MILEGPLELAICAILFSWAYIIIIGGILSDIYIPKITRASFGFSILPNIYLWFAYFLGGLLNIYLIDKVVTLVQNTLNALQIDSSSDFSFISALSTTSPSAYILILAFSLLYIGRIITKRRGVFYGKLHFASFFLVSFTLFIFNLLSTLSNIDGLAIMNSIWENYIYIIYHNISIFIEYASVCAVGTLMLATVGEGILVLTPSSPRSLLSISDKLPSDLRVITGHNGIDRKLRNMMARDKEITNLRCITKSCSIINTIQMDIYNQFFEYDEREKKNHQEKMPCFQFIRAPEDRFLEDLDRSLGKLSQRSIGIFSKQLNKEERIKRYNESRVILNNLVNDKKVEEKELYFGDLRLISLDYNGHTRNLMLLVRDGGSLMDRVGIYTEEPYIVDTFVNLFDTIWAKNISLPQSESSNSFRDISLERV